MITKQELDKLKELAKAATPGPWCRAPIFKSDWPSKRTDVAIVRGVRIIGPYANISCGDEADYVINASPDTVLRLIEALEVAAGALDKISNNCSCTELCMCSEDDASMAKQALDKIYGQSE